MRPTSGPARVLGADTVREREAAQRHIGYLPGQFVAYPDITVERYLRGRLGTQETGPLSRASLRVRVWMAAR